MSCTCGRLLSQDIVSTDLVLLAARTLSYFYAIIYPIYANRGPKKYPKTMFRGRSLHDVNIMKVDRILTMVNTYRYRVSTMIMNEYIIHISCHVPAVDCCHKYIMSTDLVPLAARTNVIPFRCLAA